MQSQHNATNLHPSAAYETRVHSDQNVKQLAHAAMKNIPGAKKIIDSHFDRSAWKIPHRFPAKKHINLPYHLGW
jgi:hypothetical protein